MTTRSRNVTSRLSTSPVPSNTVSVGMAKGLVQFASGVGVERAALMSAAGLDASSLEDDDARMPFERYAALYGAAEQLAGDPALALHFGESIDAMDLLVCHVGSVQNTMGEAFAAINRYGRLAIDVETMGGGDPFQIEVSGDGHWLIDASIYPDGIPQLTETSFTRLIVGTRCLTDRDFVRSVHFVRSVPGHVGEYARIFRAPVAFDQRRSAMLMDPAWFDLPLATASTYAGTVFEGRAEVLLDHLAPTRPHRDAVEVLIRQSLDSGAITVDFVAQQLGTSRQTLYRQLQLEGTTFEDTLAQVRRDLATQLLGEGISVSETAHRLGFSERSAFARAFKRWTGRSPRSAT